MKKCIIAGGGDPCRIPHKAAFYIGADKGHELLSENGITPDLVIGDFDSAAPPSSFSGDIITLSVDKDDTDTIFAVKTALLKGCDDFELYGCTGGRLSHTAANIQTLKFIHEHGAKGCIISDSSFITMIFENETHCFYPHSANDYISVFAEDTSIVNIEGCRYSGIYELSSSFPLGVSNHITAEKALIHAEKGNLLVIQEFPAGAEAQ